jgi:hypothetical protein
MIRERMANLVEVKRIEEDRSHDLDSVQSISIEQDGDEVRKGILSYDFKSPLI